MSEAGSEHQQHQQQQSPSEQAPVGDATVRFEDLTVDDDLPIIDRIVRYCNSQVALQRLVHVKMLAEAAELAGYVEKKICPLYLLCLRKVEASTHSGSLSFSGCSSRFPFFVAPKQLALSYYLRWNPW